MKARMSDVYATIHSVIATDPEIRRLMGFQDGLSEEDELVQRASKVLKRQLSTELLEEQTLPLITFYKLPGGREFDNYLSYLTPFDFDIYTNNDVELAIDIADRINELFDDKYLPLAKGSSLRNTYVTSGEDKTELKDVYKYYTQIIFNLSLEG